MLSLFFIHLILTSSDCPRELASQVDGKTEFKSQPAAGIRKSRNESGSNNEPRIETRDEYSGGDHGSSSGDSDDFYK